MVDEKTIKNSYFVVYLDTDEEKVKEVKAYNDRMGQLRIKKKALEEIEFGYILVNLLVIVGVVSTNFGEFFAKPVVSAVILIFEIVFYVLFGILKRNFFISTVFTIPLIFLSPIFAILTVTDILLCFLHKRYVDFLKKQTGYPLFNDIELIYKSLTESEEREYEFLRERYNFI